MISRTVLLLGILVSTVTGAFVPTTNVFGKTSLRMGADSEVSFGDLDGEDVRVGIIRTRWNDEHVSNLVSGAKKAMKEVNVKDENIFVTEVPGAFELPLAARFLALSGTVDAVICCGVLIKGDTLHFEYICDAVSSGIMSVGLQTSTPVIFGVLTCLNEEQVKKRSTGQNNHGEDWGKTAVEMALLRNEAMGAKAGKSAKMEGLGFGKAEKLDAGKKTAPGFF
mmetsp:Transcript_15464/g.33633  ORF Transcript_15464/g.33633 Transcript_15464/m.33633 type:complete len:223 (-) Transcript_15464:228-896(-)